VYICGHFLSSKKRKKVAGDYLELSIVYIKIPAASASLPSDFVQQHSGGDRYVKRVENGFQQQNVRSAMALRVFLTDIGKIYQRKENN
jgi:hypothetical protein